MDNITTDNITTDSLSDEGQMLIDINHSNDDEDKKVKDKKVKDKKVKDKKFKACLCLSIIFIIELIIVLYCISDFDNDGIGATISHVRHKRSCDDEEYGCCNIYTDCKIKNDHIDYYTIELSLYHIVAHDSIHSNCPSFKHLTLNPCDTPS